MSAIDVKRSRRPRAASPHARRPPARDRVSIQDDELITVLSTLCARVADIVHARSCGVMVADDEERPRGVVASDAPATALLEQQIAAQAGPCVDAFRSRSTVWTADLWEETGRWPGCARHARGQQLRAALAVPVRAGERTVGALQVTRAHAGAFTERDVLTAEALGEVVGHTICRERALQGAQEVLRQLQHALTSRIVIEQAKGVLAERADVPLSAAFEALRRYARSNHLRVHDVCADVIAGRLGTAALGIGPG
jgi:GAF domain-containing protein